MKINFDKRREILLEQNHWANIVWTALRSYREDCIPKGDPMYDEQWDEICTAMVNITSAMIEKTPYPENE